jgi:hypothetical protein
MEYKIISVNKNDYGELGLYEVIMKAQSELARLVNEEIEKGWRPIGGVAYYQMYIISQTMIKG